MKIPRTSRGAARDQSSGVASGHPPFVCQTFGEDVNQAPGASRQKKISMESHFWVGTSPPLCVCSRRLLAESRPSAAVNFAETHDRAVWQCLANILRTDLSECSGAVLPPLCRSLGGLGLRKATRVSGPAHWASWVDCLPMIHARHPLVATVLLHHFEGVAVTPYLREAREITDWRGLGLNLHLARRGCRSQALKERSGRIRVGMWCWLATRGQCTRGEAPERLALSQTQQRDCCDPKEGLLELGVPEATGVALPLFGGAQLAITTLVSLLHCAPGRSGAGNGKSSQGTDLPGAGGPMESLSSGGHGH